MLAKANHLVMIPLHSYKTPIIYLLISDGNTTSKKKILILSLQTRRQTKLHLLEIKKPTTIKTITKIFKY